jgi:phospholipid/cholesterol/gamma-HCH transport system substrate-binding protein
MSMEAEAKYTLVGVVVLLSVALGVSVVVWLAGWSDTISYKYFSIYFNKQSMDGLDINSAVKMRGIKVGAVTSLNLSRRDQGGVRVNVKVSENTPVNQGAQAYVKRNIVTGLSTIEITDPDPSAPLLTQVPKGEKYPVIAEGSSDIDKVATALSSMAENGAQVLAKMNGVLTEQNSRALARTLANLENLSAYLAENKNSMGETLRALHAAAEEFRTAGASVASAAAQAQDSIKDLSGQADMTLKEAADAMQKLQQQTIDVSKKLESLANTGSVEFTQIGRDVRTGADAVTAAGNRLANPRSLLLGIGKAKPGPGEK